MEEENIKKLFLGIFQNTIAVKYAFFAYLSVLLFKEGENLLATSEEKDFWTNDIWNFDGGSYKNPIAKMTISSFVLTMYPELEQMIIGRLSLFLTVLNVADRESFRRLILTIHLLHNYLKNRLLIVSSPR